MSVCWEPQRRPCTCIHRSEPSTINCSPQSPIMPSNEILAEIAHVECILFLFQSFRWSIWCSCKWDNWIWPATNWLWRREKPVWQWKVGCAKNTHFYTILEDLSTWLWSLGCAHNFKEKGLISSSLLTAILQLFWRTSPMLTLPGLKPTQTLLWLLRPVPAQSTWSPTPRTR